MKPATNGPALLHLLDPDYVAGALPAQVLAQDLQALHTRQLLALLRRLRAGQSNAVHYGGASAATAQHEFGAAISALKQQLATRAHIPNKAEAKVLRQQAAKRR